MTTRIGGNQEAEAGLMLVPEEMSSGAPAVVEEEEDTVVLMVATAATPRDAKTAQTELPGAVMTATTTTATITMGTTGIVMVIVVEVLTAKVGQVGTRHIQEGVTEATRVATAVVVVVAALRRGVPWATPAVPFPLHLTMAAVVEALMAKVHLDMVMRGGMEVAKMEAKMGVVEGSTAVGMERAVGIGPVEGVLAEEVEEEGEVEVEDLDPEGALTEVARNGMQAAHPKVAKVENSQEQVAMDLEEVVVAMAGDRSPSPSALISCRSTRPQVRAWLDDAAQHSTASSPQVAEVSSPSRPSRSGNAVIKSFTAKICECTCILPTPCRAYLQGTSRS
mmetsp:Transcript_17387/g.25783  ORF Transcript_17387/g.25783 Transcript_17387/m.25783 type:complete len:335 (+) Transcript_17387:186-1190(+)